jgi:hypothetical protein
MLTPRITTRRQRHEHQTYRENNQRHATNFARRQERSGDQHDSGGNEKQDLAIDEMKRIESDPGRDRRACGKT